MLRRTFMGLCLLCMLSPDAMAAAPDVNLGHFNKLAVNGYDVMTYWKGGNPKEGNLEITASFNGATWVFISEENRALFLLNPAKYAPQYGGYCAYAVAQGYTASTVPEAWKIVDDRLYLNYSKGVQRRWEGNQSSFITDADANWPKVLN